MNFRYLLLSLSLLLMVAFAEETEGTTNEITCNTSFKDTMSLRALDAHSRPIPGADMYAYYQYSGSTGKGGSTWYLAGPVKSDSSGMATITVYNVETNPDYVDCLVTLNASIGGTMNFSQVYANNHPSIIDVGVPVYIVSVFVRETTGPALANASVSINGQTKDTDASGFAQFYLPAGDFQYLVSYLDGKQAGSIAVDDDTAYYALLKSYSISLQVMDDYGKPLNANITIGNKTVQLGSGGSYSNPKVFGNRFDYIAEYGGVEKTGTIFPETSPSGRIVFDFSAPIIGNFTKSEENGQVRLTIPVSDPGAYASGIDTSSFSVTYREVSTNGTGQWNDATTFVVSKGIFAADFPQFSSNTVVEFRVAVADMDGNRATVSGRFAITPPPPPPVNNTGTNPPSGGEGEGLPLLYMVGGVVMLAFLVYMFLRLKKGGD